MVIKSGLPDENPDYDMFSHAEFRTQNNTDILSKAQ